MKWNEILILTIKTTNAEYQKEVIEIGISKFNVKSLRRYDFVSFFVKPEKTFITETCSKYTGITPSDVADGVSFFDLCDFLKEVYNSRNIPWAGYGNLVETVLKRQCRENNIEYPLSDRFINIRHLFPLVFSQEEELPLKEALKKLNIPAASNSCEDDVLNIGILLAEVLRGGIIFK